MSTESPVKKRAYLEVIKPLKRALEFVWMADPRSTIGMGLLTVTGGLLPAGQAWVAKLIIDSVVQGLSDHRSAEAGLRAILPYLYLEFGFFLTGAIVSQFRRLLDEILDHKIGFQINSLIIRKALRLELHYFENAEFYDKITTVRFIS